MTAAGDTSEIADSLLVTQRVAGSPPTPRSTIPACSRELTQYPGPSYLEHAERPLYIFAPRATRLAPCPR